MKLIVFSGLPGTGKSTLAEIMGKDLGIPVFAKDWLETTLVRNGLNPIVESNPPRSIGYELLTALAERQLKLDNRLFSTVSRARTTSAIRGVNCQTDMERPGV